MQRTLQHQSITALHWHTAYVIMSFLIYHDNGQM